MYTYESPKLTHQRKKFKKAVIESIIIGAILIMINNKAGHSMPWIKIPIIIMFISLIFKGLKVLSLMTSEKAKIWSQQNYQDEMSSHRINTDDYLELRDINNLKKEGQKLWKDSDLVKSNLS